MAYQPKSYRKFLATSVSAAVVATTFGAVTPVDVQHADAAENFSDVANDNTHSGAIQRLSDQGIIKGYEDGTYKPANAISRGQIAELMVRAFNLEVDENATSTYDDLSDTAYGTPYAMAVTDAGYMTGSSNGTMFNAQENLSREQMATILVRAFGLEKIDGVDSGVEDLEEAHPTHRDNVEILGQYEVTSTPDGMFRPQESVSRSQFATFLERALAIEYTQTEGISGIETVDTNTVDISFSRELSEDEVSAEDFAFSNGLEVFDAEIIDAEDSEVSTSDTETVVRLTTSDQEPGISYDLIYKDKLTTWDLIGAEDDSEDPDESAIEEAEQAIADLPEEITLEDAEAVMEARELVEAVLEMDEDAEIEGLDTLVEAEETIAALTAEMAAEEAITELPEEITLEDADEVEAVRELVDAALELNEEAEIEGLDTLVEAEEAIAAMQEEMEAIEAATEAVETAEESLLEEDLEDAQELVDELSDSDEKILLGARLDDVQDAIDVIIAEVNDASGELALFRALDQAPFENVNEDLIGEYFDGIEDVDFETISAIQDVIDDVNDAQFTEVVTDAKGAVTAVEDLDITETDEDDFNEAVEAAQEAIDALPADYMEEDEDTPLAEQLQADLDEQVELFENYTNVVWPVIDAEENGTELQLLNALSSFDNVNESHIDDYEFAGSVTLDDVQYEIDFTNAENALETFEVDSETTQEDLDELQAMIDLLHIDTDEDGELAPTEEEQELIDALADLQGELDALNDAAAGLAEAVADAEAAQEAYLEAGGEDDDDEYLAVEAALEGAEEADEDSVEALIDATTALETATTELNDATDDLNSLAEAIENAEAAQEAYIAAGGDDEEDVYTNVTVAINAEDEDEIESTTEALEEATEEIILVDSLNSAETAEELAPLLVELDNDTYNNLSSQQRLEVADWSLEVIAEGEFTSSADVSDALFNGEGEEDTGVIVDYLAAINEVNDAGTISATDQALEDLDIEEYNSLSASAQLVAAENVLNNKPDDGYTSISQIVDNF
ncbi:S-layer homology domain-containing protein [Alteribacillus sp. HJP-4]|uniref:S-layer homology domain-containing protein n=1 Tax=Alteribacillus sp. HJP-4 TaxID=2775394 RepID=UPI0035CCE1D7